MPTAPDSTALVEAYLSLAYSIANRYGRWFPWLRDDFRSLAAEALWRAALSFDPAGEHPFPRLVRLKVRSACSNRIAAERTRNKAAFRTLPADEQLDPVHAIPDRAAEVGTSFDAAELAEHVLRFVDPRSRALIELHAEGATLEDLAAAGGVSLSRVGQLLERTREKLRAMQEA